VHELEERVRILELERETLTREDLDEIFAAHELHTPSRSGMLDRAVAALSSEAPEPS